MAYNALRKMRQLNMQNPLLSQYGEKLGPMEPVLQKTAEHDLCSAALTFLHDRCVDLRFDAQITARESESGILEGVSIKKGQIPYNMQMDIDRLCMERAVERFMKSGVTEDAFDVYFCYLEMFIGRYGKSRRMIELLSEFENNSSAVLMRHRDHYSHSVYVFLLGLAIYETNEIYRKAYQDKYNLNEEQEAAHHFLKYWGLAALFHDIGYPFELPFEQVCSYFEVEGKKRKDMPYISYNAMQEYTALGQKEKEVLKAVYGDHDFSDTNELFAFEIATKLGEVYHKEEAEICEILNTKSTHPNKYNYFMDHAFFSATILLKELLVVLKGETSITRCHIDAVIAILLHNSLYKFSITDIKDENVNKPFQMQVDPLSFLLMLCDELQCWDRTSYGRNSRTELHPMGCEFAFRENGIQAVYLYDKAESDKIKRFQEKYDAYSGDKKTAPKLKAYSDMVHENKFLKDIENILDLTTIKLEVAVRLQPVDFTGKQAHLSNSNFMHLYDFAVALNAQYNALGEDDEAMMESFEQLSLEYKLSNILQAKEFEEHLDSIGYFYTDKAVAYPMVNEFSDFELVTLGVREHLRWENEKYNMCWIPAGEVREIVQDKTLREQTRMHYDLDIKFIDLSKEEQIKDMKPLNTMLQKLKEFDGLRIYKFK